LSWQGFEVYSIFCRAGSSEEGVGRDNCGDEEDHDPAGGIQIEISGLWYAVGVIRAF
jgi:hypothetical protein